MAVYLLHDPSGQPKRDRHGNYRYLLRFRRGQKACCKRVWAKDEHEAEREIDRELLKADSSLTWQEGLARFLPLHPDLTDRYQAEYSRQVDWLTREIGNKPIESTTLAMFMRYLNQRRKQVSGAAVNKNRMILLRLAKWCRSQGWINVIPFEYASSFRHKTKERIPPAPELLPAYLHALDFTTKPIFTMLAMTGCRSRAICRLQRSELHADHFIVHEKGNRTRLIMLDDDLRQVLNDAKVTRDKLGYQGQFIFCNRVRNPWTPEALLGACQRWWRMAGLQPILIHSLRHLFGTVAARRYDPSMLQQGMGHLCRSTSERYTHLAAQAATEVAQYVRSQIGGYLR